MHHAADVTDEVAAQGLAVGGGQVQPLEPVLVPLLLPEPHLKGEGEGQALLRGRPKPRSGPPALQQHTARPRGGGGGRRRGWICTAVSTDKSSSVLSPSSSWASRTALLLSEL